MRVTGNAAAPSCLASPLGGAIRSLTLMIGSLVLDVPDRKGLLRRRMHSVHHRRQGDDAGDDRGSGSGDSKAAFLAAAAAVLDIGVE